MAGLQRSQVSFRRQGSSGLVWDDKLLSGELNKTQNSQNQDQEKSQKQFQDQEQENKLEPINTLGRSRSTGGGGGRGFRTGKVSPAIEPPSPRLSVCGFCSAFGSPNNKIPKGKSGRARTGKPRAR